MNQNIWGPKLWYFMHCVSLNYPIKPTIEDKKNMYNFIMSLKSILPCSFCRVNYQRNINEIPIRLNNRKDFVCWMIDIHNEVNTKEGKKHYSYEEIIKLYEDKFNKKISFTEDGSHVNFTCSKHCWGSINIFIYIFILLMIWYIFKRYRKNFKFF